MKADSGQPPVISLLENTYFGVSTPEAGTPDVCLLPLALASTQVRMNEQNGVFMKQGENHYEVISPPKACPLICEMRLMHMLLGVEYKKSK